MQCTLPFPSSIENDIKLSIFDRLVIDDVLNHYQEFIRQPESSNTLKPILSRSIAERLSCFSNIFCEALNDLYQNSTNRFRLENAGRFHHNNFIYIEFRYDSQPEGEIVKGAINLPEVSETELKKLLTLDKEHTRFQRILKIYKKDSVIFIKPNQLRYWLDSIALRDADWVISDLAEQGF